jgi:chorismate--pyruvate lyase
MAASGRMAPMIPGKISNPGAVEWLPAERLGQMSVDALLRPWLIGKGLLTQRLKVLCGARFSLRLVEQRTDLLDEAHKRGLGVRDGAGLFREVEMFCDERVWVFAETIMPDSTLSAHPWLAELGDSALGETLSDLSGLQRSSYEYAWLPGADALCARALRATDVKPPGVWARRSKLSLRGAPVLVQELFLPAMGRI